MINRTLRLALALVACSAVMRALPVAAPLERPVPAIPHGQNWELCLPPDPQIVPNLLPVGEVLQIVPAPPRLLQSPAVYEVGALAHGSLKPTIEVLVGILVSAIFLLAGFDLIPRAHAGSLRLRSLNLPEDLLS